MKYTIKVIRIGYMIIIIDTETCKKENRKDIDTIFESSKSINWKNLKLKKIVTLKRIKSKLNLKKVTNKLTKINWIHWLKNEYLKNKRKMLL